MNWTFSFLSKRNLLAIITSIFFGLASLIIVKKDAGFAYRWVALSLHIFSLLPITALFVFGKSKKLSLKRVFSKKEILPLVFLLFLALTSRFILLKDYPFVSLGDELRDGGLDAIKIYRGEIKNIFEYGHYSGYGLQIPLLTSLFYKLLGSSVLVYRLPAAIVSTLDIVLVYILGRLILGRKLAFWSAFVLIASHLHLFLSRTEIVVIFDSLITSLVLLTFHLSKKKEAIDCAFLGSVLGFSLAFHSSVKIVVILAFLFFLVKVLGTRKANFFKEKLPKALLLIIFVFVGLGPRLWFTTPEIFFQKNKSFYAKRQLNSGLIKDIGRRYLKSFPVWFNAPISSRSPEPKPLFPPVLVLFLVVGLAGSVFLYKKSILFLIVSLGFIAPLTNSALSDTLNMGQRITVLLPIGVILAGVGICVVSEKLANRKLHLVFSVVLSFYLIIQTVNFFSDRVADKYYGGRDYLFMNLIYFLRDNNWPITDKICLRVSQSNYQTLDLMHYKEQWDYFFSDIQVTRKADDKVLENEIYLFEGSCLQEEPVSLKNVYKIDCKQKNLLYCPPKTREDFNIYY